MKSSTAFGRTLADTVGSASVAADAEICAMLAAALEHAGIARGDYLIRINNRKVLNGILESMGVAEGKPADDVLRTIDKFDKVGEQYADTLIAGKINYDEEPQLIERFGIDTIPTLMLFKSGEVIGSVVAPGSKAAIETFIRETLAQ